MHGIEVEGPGPATTVGAWGEFDAFSLPVLRRALDEACGRGVPVVVDLSGITFLDLQSARELAVRAMIQGHQLSFENPPACVLASFRALGLDGPRNGPNHREPQVFSGA